MKTSLHTPGPWAIDESGANRKADGSSYWLVYAPDPSGGGFDVIVLADLLEEADARLIAAAPKLLAACKAVLSSPTYGNTPSDEAVALVEAAIAATEAR